MPEEKGRGLIGAKRMAELIRDYTIFMTKPWCERDVEASAIWMLEDYLSEKGNFEREFFARGPIPPRKFWKEFYKDIRKWEGFNTMIEDFTTLQRGPIVASYSGSGVAEAVKEILGPTHYADNIGKQTIRGVLGNSEDISWRNIAHAPKSEEVAENLKVLKKYNLIE